MIICTSCRREVVIGQQVLRNHILEPAGKLVKAGLQHANCYDADGPKYDADGNEMVETRKGYIKPFGEAIEAKAPFHPAMGYHYER